MKRLAVLTAALALACGAAMAANTPPTAPSETPAAAPAATPAAPDATAPAATPAAPASDAAAPPPPPPAPAGPYQGATLTSVTYAMPSMTKMSAGAAALGVIGALVTMGEGDKIVQGFHVGDAAVAISARLTPLVAAHFQTGNSVVMADLNSNDERDLANQANHAGVVLDVETREWIVNYFAFDWGHYKLQYGARARLIDAKTGKVIGKSKCYYTSSDDADPPNDSRVVDNDAAWLKDRLTRAADLCVATFTAELIDGKK